MYNEYVYKYTQTHCISLWKSRTCVKPKSWRQIGHGLRVKRNYCGRVEYLHLPTGFYMLYATKDWSVWLNEIKKSEK